MSQSQIQESGKTSSDFEVTDKLYKVSEATNDDGTVTVHIEDFDTIEDRRGESVVVEFTTPTGETKSEMMEWPDKDSDEYKFVRICNETVGGLNGAEWLKTDGAEIKADPDSWTIVTEKSLLERFRERLPDFDKSRAYYFERSIGYFAAATLITLIISTVLFIVSYIAGTLFFSGAAIVSTLGSYSVLLLIADPLIGIFCLMAVHGTLVEGLES